MNKKFLTSTLCGAVVLAICVWFAMDYLSLPQNKTPTTQADTNTTTYFERFFLPSQPSDWFSVGESINWNGIFTFNTENMSAQKTLPDGFRKEEFRFVNRVPTDEWEAESAPEWFEAKADDNFTLTSDHLYVTLTLRITCTGVYPYDFFGLEEDERNTVSVGNCVIGEYDITTQRIVREHNLACYHALESDFHQGNGLFELGVGDSTAIRIAYVIKESHWNNDSTAFLLTPMHAHYDAFDLNELGFSLPQVWLNERK